jgi:hypothetical protein
MHAARMAARPPVAHYRLSRKEYQNTIYDLLGVHYDPTEPGQLNEDTLWHGYERIGSELSLSPSHVDRYYRAAELVLDRAFPSAPKVARKVPGHLPQILTLKNRPYLLSLESIAGEVGSLGRVRRPQINKESIRVATSMAPKKTLERYDQIGRLLTIGADIDMSNLGPLWIWKPLVSQNLVI